MSDLTPKRLQEISDMLKDVDTSKLFENTPNILSQFNVPQPIQPKFPSRYGEGEDCVNLEFCSNKNISVAEVCTANGEYQRERCRFGDTRIIMLLSSPDKEELDK